MKRSPKKLIIILAPLVIYAVIALVMVSNHFMDRQSTASASNAGASEPVTDTNDYEFAFNGTVETSTGRTFTLDMLGNRDEEKTLSLTVKEMPALNLSGTWDFTEGKGYKMFLNDAAKTFMYSRYNPETKQFTVTFDYNMGNFGQPRAVLSYTDEEFASQYDGEGLGTKPPVFALEGYSSGAHYSYGTLSCAEDGTASANLTNTGAGWYFNRYGTWTYDEAADQYDIVFTDQTISLTDGNFNIHEDAGGDYIAWTKYTRDLAEPRYRDPLPVSELEETYHLFTDPYVYHAQYDSEKDGYYIEIEAQWNWGLGHGDLITLSGYASRADMEG